MHPRAPLESHVDTRGRIIEVASTESDQPYRQATYLPLARAPRGHPLGTVASVDEEAVLSVDEDIAHGGIVEEGAEEREGGVSPCGRRIGGRRTR